MALDTSLLVACILVVVGSILYLFYWNSALGFLISILLRALFWSKRGSSVWLKIGSFHVSLLSGRIFLKDVKYYSSNQTIKIVKAEIIWQYWLRRPASEADLPAPRMDDEYLEKMHPLKRPCRVQIEIHGLEWFIYNRTASYDIILGHILQATSLSRPSTFEQQQQQQQQQPPSRHQSPDGQPLPERSSPLKVFRIPERLKKAIEWTRKQLPQLEFNDLLPLGIFIAKGAIVIGNVSTPSLLVADFKKAEGNFGIVQSRSRFDFYKQLLSLEFTRPFAHYVTNHEFREPMADTGKHIEEIASQKPSRSLPLKYSSFLKLWRSMNLYKLLFSRRARKAFHELHIQDHAQKRKQSLEEPSPADLKTHEYAIERRILEAPVLHLSYYVDVVGDVPSASDNPHFRHPSGELDVGNGDTDPEWGVDIVIRRGTLRYGPWSDRQRAELQRAFFPPSFSVAEPFPSLHPGDQRQWTDFRVFVELRDETTVEIPFREASKNWQWDGLSELPNRPKRREPASIHFKTGDRSSISYVMPMVARTFGYESSLEVHLDTIIMTSSLNDIRVITAESARIRCSLPAPLAWDASREWVISVSLRQPLIHLLRDHINMFTDLGKDWTSGPPSDYFRFVPTTYKVDIHLIKYIVNLYCNDLNLVDKPLAKDENALLSFNGDHIRGNVIAPMDTYRPEYTDVTFTFEAPHLKCDLSLPKWHTHFLPEAHNIGFIERFLLDGSYLYYAETHEDHIDCLALSFSARHIAYKALGWSIRYFMLFQANYFGSYTHYTTLSEFLRKFQKQQALGDPVEDRYRPGQSNMLQVELEVEVDKGLIIFPAGLPGYDAGASSRPRDHIGSALCIDMPELQLHLRLHDYFMEMSLNMGPMYGWLEPNVPERVSYFGIPRKEKPFIVIDSLDIVADRLFGPMPRTSTYLCVWEIAVGHVHAIFTADEARTLGAVGKAFTTNFSDVINSPAQDFQPPAVPDVTFIKVTLGQSNLIWYAGKAALAISLDKGLSFDNNDMGSQFHKSVTSLRVPHLACKVLIDKGSIGTHWLEAAELALDIDTDIYSAPAGWRLKAFHQAKYVEREDNLTGRFEKFLTGGAKGLGQTHRNGLFLPQPRLPQVRLKKSARKVEASFSSLLPDSVVHSDSDVEHSVSIADRDARVAHLRSITPRPAPSVKAHDREHHVGTDETDDAEFSDNSDSSDYDSEEETLPPSLLKRFSKVSRTYKSRHLKNPSLWRGSPFIVSRDPKPLASPSLHSEALPHIAKELPADITHSSEDDETVNLKVVRMTSRNGIRFRSTPLLFWATRAFESDLEAKTLSPQRFLDSLMASALAKRPPTIRKSSCLKFDAQISQAHLHILQDVALSEEVFLGAKPKKTSEAHPFPAVVALLVDCHGFQTKGRWADDMRCFCVGTDSFSVNLSTAVTEHLPHFSLPKAAIMFYLSDLALSMAMDNIDVSWNESTVHVGHHGPEYVLAFLKTVTRHIKPMRLAAKKWKSFRRRVDRHQLLSILRRSTHDVDRLSIIQPSYLVQHQVPNFLRDDPEFRLLFAFQEALGSSDGPFEHDYSLDEDGGGMDVEELLQQRLENYIDPTELDSFEPVVFARFLSVPSSPTSVVSQPGKLSLSLTMQRLSLVILDPQGALGGRISLENLNLKLRIYAALMLPSPAKSFESVRDTRTVRISASAVLDDAEIIVLPTLLDFAQHIFRVRRRYASSFARLEAFSQSHATQASEDPQALDFSLSLGSFRLRAVAATLTCEFGLTRLQLSTMTMTNSIVPPADQAVISLLFGEIFVHAKSSQSRGSFEEDILASMSLTGGKVGTTFSETSGAVNLKSTADLGGLDISVPRSAIRLYRFVTQWQESFLPAIEATMQELIAEIQSNRKSTPAKTKSRSPMSPHILLRLSSLRVYLQVMAGTWLSWDIHDTFVQLDLARLYTSNPSYDCAARCTSQLVAVRTTDRTVVPETRLKLALPAISFKARYTTDVLTTYLLFSFLSVTVKPSHWDTFLSVQQKFGQDFTDLVNIIQETRSKRPKKVNVPSSSPSIKYTGYLKFHGFRIGLRAATSALYLECFDVQGDIDNSNGMKWRVGATDLALSLVPRANDRAVRPKDTQHANFMRDFKSAFVIIDFLVSARTSASGGTRTNTLALKVPKIHAVMQASAISEFGDFVDHLQSEILRKKDERKAALDEFKLKTQNLLTTFELKLPDVKEVRQPTLLAQYTIDIGIHNIGVAFPLAHDLRLGWPALQSEDAASVRAFLFSIDAIKFATQQGETGQATVDALSLQFVPQFRQTVATDFAAGSHPKRNRLYYPSMQAQLKSSLTGGARAVWVSADVRGFVLDLDPTISDYVFSLVDVYRQGEERVARLNLLAGTAKHVSHETKPGVAPPAPPEATELNSIRFLGLLTFRSGKIRIHSRRNGPRPRTSSSLHTSPPVPVVADDPGIEIFNLPAVSVWSEYRSKTRQAETSMLIFKSTIHSSQNTLTPELLPFLADVVETIEARLRSTRDVSFKRSPFSPPIGIDEREPPLNLPPADGFSKKASSLHICFSLRIDQSKLQLTCQPDVNVIAGLYWESGGFMISISPGARHIAFTGSVGGLTVGLKHGFLTEECVKLDARNLAFSISFSKSKPELPILSLVVQTELHGQARFSRLQDILCFKAVWLDRIPVLHSQPQVVDNSAKSSAIIEPPQPFQTSVLVRIRQIDLQMDLGHSITTVNFDLRDAVLRTKITESIHHVAISLDDLTISAKGNVAGQAKVSNCVFETIRRAEASMASWEDNQMLEMRLTSSALTANLESEHQKLLHYRAEPLEIKIFDDWSSMVPEPLELEKPFQLSFTVDGPEISAIITVNTVPVLLKYINLFKANLDLQREAASRESKTFRRGHTIVPDNPLSAVAQAMIQSARNRLEVSSPEYTMRQHISLRLSVLRLVVFPRTMGDLEAAELFASDVLAELHGSGEVNSTAERQLHLSFHGLSVSKYTRTATLPPFDEADSKNWLMSLHNGSIESNIAGLPAMDIHMESEETRIGDQVSIVYDFDSRFIRLKPSQPHVGDTREDIFITLNMNLYVWLTGFRKGFQRGMDEATKAKTRVPNVAVVGGGGPSRIRKTESLRVAIPPQHPRGPMSARGQTLQGPPPIHIPVPPMTAAPKVSRGNQEDTLASPTSDSQSPTDQGTGSSKSVAYHPRNRQIERLTMRQLGEATPDLTHPFFKKTAGFTLEDSFPQLVHEYATVPLEQIMQALLKLYTRQLLSGQLAPSP